ncbi:endonuclease/exonuclease/phosphatase family protein [Nitzschia inconspicua]|uniref:Endonuclease/exonuclease/phosphatase family protein n=1 Tax=Nitzschia inconspicua TaxID=303405 RepID=A0A9K3KCK7_9STRA|nr:endonuclease/exonuclease/phosphatase family protein [Nitzschia inconspicua]
MGEGGTSAAALTSPPLSSPPPIELRALQFNVWLDATKVKDGLELTASAILDSNADVVSLNEVKNFWGNDFVSNLKKELHYQQEEREKQGESQKYSQWYGNFPGNPHKLHIDADTAIISRYPVLEELVVYRTPENSIVRSLIEMSPRQPPVVVYSVHLEYRAYSCYLPRGYNSHSASFPGWNPVLAWQQRKADSADTTFWASPSFSYLVGNCLGTVYGLVVGDSTKSQDDLYPITDVDVIHQDNLSSGRPEAIEKILEDVEALSRSNTHYRNNASGIMPVIIMGDFNEPSTLDWTEDTKHTAGHNGVVYQWETTRRLLNAGWVDSYRELHPNPLTHPGYTWPAAVKGKNNVREQITGWLRNADERDRIDFIFYKNQATQNKEPLVSDGQRPSHIAPSLALHPVDAWLVGTPVIVVGDTLLDESSKCDSSEMEAKTTTLAECKYRNCKPTQDQYLLKVGSLWPSDHRAVMTIFELRSTTVSQCSEHPKHPTSVE